MNRKEYFEEVKEIIEQAKIVGNTGNRRGAIQVLEDGLKEYPNNLAIKEELLNWHYGIYDPEDECKDNEKRIEILALELKEHEDFKNSAIQILVHLYKELGRQGELKDDVLKLPSFYQSKNMLLPNVLKGEERIRAVQRNFIDIFVLFYCSLLSTYGRKEVGKRDKVLLKIKSFLDTVFEDGDYGYYAGYLEHMYYKCALDQANVNNKEKVIEYLRQASKYAKEYDKLRFETKEFKYTSFLVDRITESNSSWFFGTEKTCQEELKEELKREVFDFIREDEEFKKILNN